MATILRAGLRWHLPVFQAYNKQSFLAKNPRNAMCSTIDSSARTNKVGIGKLNFGSSKSCQASRENSLRSKSCSILLVGNGRCSYSTSISSARSRFLHHSFELVSLKRTNHHYSYEGGGGSRSKKTNVFSFILLFLAAIGTIQKNHAESSHNTALKRIETILNQSSEERTPEETMELFNYVVAVGENEAKKAKGKDVVIVFGDTGSGKSTLINFLYGCTLKQDKNDPYAVVVDRKSHVPEVTEIGSGSVSCTLSPKMVGDLAEPNTLIERHLTFFDMPGLNDNRGGFEIDLATAIVMKKIVENARSVRFVMVSEGSFALRGKNWAEVAKLFTDRFRGTEWSDKNALSLVMTKTRDDIERIKRNIREYTPRNCVDLSNYATVYNPLNSYDRVKQLDIIFNIKPYQSKNIRIVVKKDTLFEARRYGEKLQSTLHVDLDHDKIKEAKEKIKFVEGMAKFGDPDLSRVIETAILGIDQYVKKIIKKMDEKEKSPEILHPDLMKYIAIRDAFKEYTNYIDFGSLDVHAKTIRKQCSDTRLFAWDKPTATGVGVAATAVAAGTGAFSSIPIATAAIASGVSSLPAATALVAIGPLAAGVGAAVFTVVAAWRLLMPSQKDKQTSEFFDKKI